MSVAGVPQGWTATLLGGGQPVAAAMPATDDSVSLDLRLDVPKDAKIGTQTLTVSAQGRAPASRRCRCGDARQGIAGQADARHRNCRSCAAPRRSSFEYTLHHQERQRQEAAGQPRRRRAANFDTSFTEAYGSQQLTAIPVDAGKTKDVKLKVSPPSTVDAGHYPVTVHVAADGAKADGRRSRSTSPASPSSRSPAAKGSAQRARHRRHARRSIPVVVTNTGTAPAENVKLSGNAPNGWKIDVRTRRRIDRIAPNQHKEVQALITPAGKAIAGDYVTTLTAVGRAARPAPRNFRVTVTTSTVWGVAGVGIIGAALLIMVGAVARFGRR